LNFLNSIFCQLILAHLPRNLVFEERVITWPIYSGHHITIHGYYKHLEPSNSCDAHPKRLDLPHCSSGLTVTLDHKIRSVLQGTHNTTSQLTPWFTYHPDPPKFFPKFPAHHPHEINETMKHWSGAHNTSKPLKHILSNPP
jgi:hypothetical protein